MLQTPADPRAALTHTAPGVACAWSLASLPSAPHCLPGQQSLESVPTSVLAVSSALQLLLWHLDLSSPHCAPATPSRAIPTARKCRIRLCSWGPPQSLPSPLASPTGQPHRQKADWLGAAGAVLPGCPDARPGYCHNKAMTGPINSQSPGQPFTTSLLKLPCPSSPVSSLICSWRQKSLV